MTVWPSGLRQWLEAPFRKGVASNPTAVNAPQLEPPLAPWYSSWSPHPTPKSRSRDSGHGSCFGGRHRIGGACGSYIECAAIACMHDSLAERSKAVAQGAIPKGRGLGPHRRQSVYRSRPAQFPLCVFLCCCIPMHATTVTLWLSRCISGYPAAVPRRHASN